MSAEGYVIFEDTTWYQKHKEEIKEQIISLDTYVRHPMQIGAYLIKEGEYWLKGIESKPPPADWPYSVRIFLDQEDYIFIEISAHPPSIERTLTQFLNWIRIHNSKLLQVTSKEIANGILRAVGIIVLVVLGLYTLYLLQSIIIYLIVSLVLTLMGKPLIQFFYKRLKIKSKTLCVILTMTIFILLALSVFSLFIPLLVSQGKNLSGLNIDLLKTNIDNLIQQTLSKVGLQKEDYSFGVQEMLNFIDIPNFLNSFISFISDFGVGAFSVLFISFFFMKDGEKILIALLSTFSTHRKRKLKTSIFKINNLLSRYFVGLILQITILFVIYTVILLIFGVENAFIIALLCALLNLIPYVGPMIGFVLMALLTMSSNLQNDFMSVSLPTTIYVLVGFLIGQLVDNVFSQPLIFSNSVKSTALEIFLITLISGTLFGMVGMVVAIPAYTVLKVVLKEFFPNNKIVELLTKNL